MDEQRAEGAVPALAEEFEGFHGYMTQSVALPQSSPAAMACWTRSMGKPLRKVWPICFSAWT